MSSLFSIFLIFIELSGGFQMPSILLHCWSVHLSIVLKLAKIWLGLTQKKFEKSQFREFIWGDWTFSHKFSTKNPRNCLQIRSKLVSKANSQSVLHLFGLNGGYSFFQSTPLVYQIIKNSNPGRCSKDTRRGMSKLRSEKSERQQQHSAASFIWVSINDKINHSNPEIICLVAVLLNW
jgi:hypothetical protein